MKLALPCYPNQTKMLQEKYSLSLTNIDVKENEMAARKNYLKNTFDKGPVSRIYK